MSKTDFFDAIAIKVRAPSGKMIVVINEHENKPHSIQIYIGKTGSTLFAWTSGLAELVSLALQGGITLEKIMSALSNITSDKLVRDGEVLIRSDIDALVYAMNKYKHNRYNQSDLVNFKPRRILNQP